MEITLRATHEEDFEFVFQLNKTNMKKYVDEIRGRDESFERQEMKKKFTPGIDKIIQVNSQDVGVWRLLEDESHIHIDHIEILPERQNHGIGRYLFTELIKSANRTHKNILLKVLKQNPAIDFYKKYGFIIIGEDELKYRMEYTPE